MIPVLDLASGLLPPGRHQCSETDIETTFVSAAAFATSTTRAGIWRDWQSASQLLRGAVRVHAAWLGGSFTTNKINPDDIDVTFLINGEDYRNRSLNEQQITALFGSGARVKATLGLNVDSYVVAWQCVPRPRQFSGVGIEDRYFWERGHWDDWWQRQRLTPKGSSPTPADTPPRRGYLEVPFSDYP